jgi:phospholipid-binding lipoprotein MlaA
VVLENLISQFLYSKAADGPTTPANGAKSKMSDDLDLDLQRPLGAAGVAAGGVAAGRAGRLRQRPGRNPRDPLESFNRDMSRFNDAVDAPCSSPWPRPTARSRPLVRTGVSNFFGNLGDVWSFVNNVLQLVSRARPTRPCASASTPCSAWGRARLASEVQIERTSRTSARPWARWRAHRPYMVLPVLGPPRCATPWPAGHLQGDVVTSSTTCRCAIRCMRCARSTRAQSAGASRVLDEAALDKYLHPRRLPATARSERRRPQRPRTMTAPCRPNRCPEPRVALLSSIRRRTVTDCVAQAN